MAYAFGQGSAQVLALVSALLIVHALSPDDYAVFTFALAYLGVASSIVDGGLGNAVVGLLGDRASEPKEVGLRVYAAVGLRKEFLAVALLITPFIYCPLAFRLGGDTVTVACTLLVVEISLVLQQSQILASVMRIGGAVSRLYLNLNSGAVARLTVLVLLTSSNLLSSITAVASGLVALSVSALDMTRYVRRTVPRPTQLPADVKRQTRRYVAPLLPGVIFVAFQGQISVLLGGLLGSSSSVGQIGALSRIAQLVAFLTIANGVLLAPRFGRLILARARLLLLVAVTATAVITAIAVLAFGRFPGMTELMLGRSYGGLTPELQLMLISSGVYVCAQQVFAFNSARRFIFWWHSAAEIIFVVTAQVIGVLALDLNTTRGLIYLGLIAGCTTFIVHMSALVFGHVAGPRSLDR